MSNHFSEGRACENMLREQEIEIDKLDEALEAACQLSVAYVAE